MTLCVSRKNRHASNGNKLRITNVVMAEEDVDSVTAITTVASMRMATASALNVVYIGLTPYQKGLTMEAFA